MQRLSSRVLSVARHGQQHWVLDVPEGESIWSCVSASFTQHDIQSAHLDLMGGHLQSAIFYTGYPDPTGKRIAQYGAPNHVGNTMLISAMGMVGKDKEGKLQLHCHGCLVVGNQLTQGGHLDTEQCIVGKNGLRIYVTVSNDIEFVAQLDATSGMYVFHPQLVETQADAASQMYTA